MFELKDYTVHDASAAYALAVKAARVDVSSSHLTGLVQTRTALEAIMRGAANHRELAARALGKTLCSSLCKFIGDVPYEAHAECSPVYVQWVEIVDGYRVTRSAEVLNKSAAIEHVRKQPVIGGCCFVEDKEVTL